MSSSIEVPVKEFEEFVVTKLRSRLKDIVWGENCYSLKEALTFDEEWFFRDHLSPDYYTAMQDFLFRSKLTPKRVILNGRSSFTWTIPFNIENRPFKEVIELYEASLNEVVKKLYNAANNVLERFIYGIEEAFCVDVRNCLYKNILIDRLTKYNRELIYLRNSSKFVYMGSEREHAYFSLTSKEDAMIISRKPDMYWHIKYAEEQYEKVLLNGVYHFLLEATRIACCCGAGNAPKKLVTYIACQYVREVKDIFETQGFEVYVLPRHSERRYTSVYTPHEGYIPVYFEVPTVLNYSPLMQSDSINLLYKNFCSYYR